MRLNRICWNTSAAPSANCVRNWRRKNRSKAWRTNSWPPFATSRLRGNPHNQQIGPSVSPAPSNDGAFSLNGGPLAQPTYHAWESTNGGHHFSRGAADLG